MTCMNEPGFSQPEHVVGGRSLVMCICVRFGGRRRFLFLETGTVVGICGCSCGVLDLVSRQGNFLFFLSGGVGVVSSFFSASYLPGWMAGPLCAQAFVSNLHL